MGVNLYSLRRRAVMVLRGDVERESVYFLQLAVEHALSQDSQRMVESALKHASREWMWCKEVVRLVVQVGADGFPRSGAPIFEWLFPKRVHCFEHELPAPVGYLGERDLWGYTFCSAKNEASSRGHRAAWPMNEGRAGDRPYWNGNLAESEEESLRYRAGKSWSQSKKKRAVRYSEDYLPPRLLKILTLIRLIEGKGSDASPADLHFLGCLRDKAAQLDCQC